MEDIGLQMAYDTQGLTINIEHFSSFPDLYIAEPKYDGLRTACFIKDNTVEFVTRFGNPVYNIVDVKNDLLEQVQKQDLLNDFMLDGELYSRNWNETISITKTFRKDIKSTNIIFYVFDIIPIKDFENKNSNLLLKDRKSLLKRLVKNTNKIRKVDYTYIHDVKDAYILYDKFIEQNLEGIMLKRIDSKYKFRRTKDWLKMKNILSDEFLVIDLHEGTGKYTGMFGAVTIELKDNSTTRVGTGFTDNERKKYWNNKELILNKYIEVAFQEYTNAGKLRNPRFVRIREDIL